MKRFLLISAVFCAAAFIGMGVTLFLPADAYADICDYNHRHIVFECDSPICSPPTPHAMFDCGTFVGSGWPCDCNFVACRLRCLEPIER